MAELNFYPWQVLNLNRLQKQLAQNRLPHALLFSGPPHVGKLDFALYLSSLLLCREHTGCGKCKTCLLQQAGSHPDFRTLMPEASQIKIDQVRELIDWSNQTAQMAGMKVAVVCPADQMNHSAANALLKCLEEPSANSLLILVSSRPSALLPTVRSRCQTLPFGTPAHADALAWLSGQLPGQDDLEQLLDIAGGAPLLVLEMAQNDYMAHRSKISSAWKGGLLGETGPVDAARTLDKIDLELVLLVTLGLLRDSVKLAFCQNQVSVQNRDLADILAILASRWSRRALLSRVSRVESDLRLARSTANPSKTLLLEALFIDLLTDETDVESEINL